MGLQVYSVEDFTCELSCYKLVVNALDMRFLYQRHNATFITLNASMRANLDPEKAYQLNKQDVCINDATSKNLHFNLKPFLPAYHNAAGIHFLAHSGNKCKGPMYLYTKCKFRTVEQNRAGCKNYTDLRICRPRLS